MNDLLHPSVDRTKQKPVGETTDFLINSSVLGNESYDTVKQPCQAVSAMSFSAQAWAITIPTSLTGKAVLMALAYRADENGKCWPSISRICADTCMSERSARSAVAFLVEAGLILRDERSGSSTVYTLILSAVVENDEPLHLLPPSPAVNAPLPGTTCPPPRQEMPPTPASPAPKQSLNNQESSEVSNQGKRAPSVAPPLALVAIDGVHVGLVEKPKRKSSTDSRGYRLPQEWKPSRSDSAFASGIGLDADQVAVEFRDYWIGVPGSKGLKLDWDATFRNQCRRTASRRDQNVASRYAPRPERISNAEKLQKQFDEMYAPAFTDDGRMNLDQSPVMPFARIS